MSLQTLSRQHRETLEAEAPRHNEEPLLAAHEALPSSRLGARRRRRHALWRSVSFRLSGLATGMLALAALAIFLMVRPAPAPIAATADATLPAVAGFAKPPAVSVVKATVGPITRSVIVTGNLVAREEVLVAAQIDGYAIEEILADEGDLVTRGQVLARLSRPMIEAALAQNDAQIARAEAAIAQSRSAIDEAQAMREQAQNAFARSQTLRRDGITTADTLELREAAAKQTDARLNAAQHALAVAQADLGLAKAQRSEWLVRLERTEIKAPTGGVVSRRTARIGAVATTAGEPLFRIIADGALELEAEVSEATLAELKPGMPALLTVAGQETPVPATIRLVAPEVDRTTRLGRVRLAIQDPAGLKLGGFARASVKIASRDGLLVPQSAVLYADDGASVQVVRDGIVSTRKVAIGLRADTAAEVTGALAAGDEVVATAGTFVRDGDHVTAVPTAAN